MIDAYAYGGQKCSAQSILFIHENSSKAGILPRLKELAFRRTLQDLTITPNLTVTNETLHAHVKSLLRIPGAKLLFGGDLIEDHSIPSCYGSFKPTAVQVFLLTCLCCILATIHF